MVASVSARTPSLHNVRSPFVHPALRKGDTLRVTHQEPNLLYTSVRTIEKNPSHLLDSLPGAVGDLGADTLQAVTALPKPPSSDLIAAMLSRVQKSSPEKLPQPKSNSIPNAVKTPDKTSENFSPQLNIGLEHTDPILREIYSQDSPQQEERSSQIITPKFFQQIANSIGDLLQKPLSSSNLQSSRPNHHLSKLSPQQQKNLDKLNQLQKNLGYDHDLAFEIQ